MSKNKNKQERQDPDYMKSAPKTPKEGVSRLEWREGETEKILKSKKKK